MKILVSFPVIVILNQITFDICTAVTMEQFQDSLNLMRSICAPKHKVTIDMLDDLRKGIFAEDQELKCYTKCIAQMAGTLSKKGDMSYQRMKAQISVILPPELQGPAQNALEHCKDTQNNYKDSCEKSFYTTKCFYEFGPDNFYFP